MIRIGLIVNPIAGMGGCVGLRGTDGNMHLKAVELDAKPVTPQRIEEVLTLIERKDIFFMVAPEKMGEDYIKKFDFEYDIVGEIGEITDAKDTKRIADEMIKKGIEILMFVGGDGTARDICDVVDSKIPVIAIPAGVKMFSSVFALSAHAAAEMVDHVKNGFIEREVLDIDEEVFRQNRLAAKLYGYMKVPEIRLLLQRGKDTSHTGKSDEVNKTEVAKYFFENMEENTLYILGPGTTLQAIADLMNVEKVLLGIDSVYNKELVGSDLNERKLIDLIKKYEGKAKIVVTPIGGNGFIFGRASKQISPDVLKLVGKENIIVIGTSDKIRKLECLRVDTGDFEVDESLGGYINVIVGYKEELVMEVKY